MKIIMNLCWFVILLTACSSNELDRAKALQLIREKKIYPKIITYEVYTADPIYARRAMEAGLENFGMLTVQRTQKLMDIGKPLISFTDKANPYLLNTSEEDRKSAIQLVKIADQQLEDVTGLQLLEDEKHAVVEYQTSYKNITPFSVLSTLKLNQKESHKAYFSLYDDGWRLEEKDEGNYKN